MRRFHVSNAVYDAIMSNKDNDQTITRVIGAVLFAITCVIAFQLAKWAWPWVWGEPGIIRKLLFLIVAGLAILFAALSLLMAIHGESISDFDLEEYGQKIFGVVFGIIICVAAFLLTKWAWPWVWGEPGIIRKLLFLIVAGLAALIAFVCFYLAFPDFSDDLLSGSEPSQEPQDKSITLHADPLPAEQLSSRVRMTWYEPDDAELYQPGIPANTEADDTYGISDKQLHYLLHHCKARVRGLPGSGLGESGFDYAHQKAGQRGEISIAKALLASGLLDDSNTSVWFSLRNPSDTSGQADIDIALIYEDRLYLLDAKRFVPEHEGEVLLTPHVAPLTPAPWILKTSGGKEYTATVNMKLATETVKREIHELAKCDTVMVIAEILLARTPKGTLGTENTGVRWPGDVPVESADAFIDDLLQDRRFIAFNSDTQNNVERYLDSLVKDQDWSQGASDRMTETISEMMAHNGKTTYPIQPLFSQATVANNDGQPQGNDEAEEHEQPSENRESTSASIISDDNHGHLKGRLC